VSDEELLLRYMVPLEDLQAAYAAGPVNPSYAFADTTTLRDLIDHAMTLKRPRNLRVSTPEGSFALGGGQR
jgi:hypothetical protein